MIIILITILIALVIAGITIKKNWKTHTSKVQACIFRPIIAIFLGCLLGVVLAVFIGLFFPKKTTIENMVPIYSMEDVFGTSGSFYLGFGNITTTPYYYYYRKNGEGMTMDKIEAKDNIIIIEQDSTQPRIEFLANDFANKNNLLWGIPTGDCGAKIIVPKKSIKNNFNFDLK
jgi:hypothetical protein